jgi:hypothetical protein
MIRYSRFMFGRVAERSIATVSKTVTCFRFREFKSHPFRFYKNKLINMSDQEKLRGHDCMVRAAISVNGKVISEEEIDRLYVLRLRQIESNGNVLDPLKEAENLSQLFQELGLESDIETQTVQSIGEVSQLLDDDKNVLLGFEQGTSTAPHIVHVEYVVSEGFWSPQQFLHEEALIDELMQQGVIQVFIQEK